MSVEFGCHNVVGARFCNFCGHKLSPLDFTSLEVCFFFAGDAIDLFSDILADDLVGLRWFIGAFDFEYKCSLFVPASYCTCCSINDSWMLVWLESGTLFVRTHDWVFNTVLGNNGSIPGWNRWKANKIVLKCVGVWPLMEDKIQRWPPQETHSSFWGQQCIYPHMYSTSEGWENREHLGLNYSYLGVSWVQNCLMKVNSLDRIWNKITYRT